jgi:YVTN family beta-propeller protein
VDAQTLTLLAEAPVGDDPRTVTFTPDGALALVANRGAETISFVDVKTMQVIYQMRVGAQPYGVVADGQRAYVSLFAAGEVAVVDLAARAMVHRIPVVPFPSGLALAGGDLYVTHFYSGRVTRVELSSLAPVQVIDTDPQANLAQFIALSPDGARAYLPQTRSNASNLSLTYDTTVFPTVSVLDLATFTPLASARLDLSRADRPVNLPLAAAVSPDGATLYVANAGSDDVSVINLATGQAVAHLSVGRNPRGLALASDGARLFVVNALDGSLSVFDLTPSSGPPLTLPLTTLPLPANILMGKRLFNSALPPMSHGGWVSCASCHFDGGHDARTWLGFPDGPRDTPALFGAAQTLPLHWSGDLDELQDVELTIRRIQGGAGLISGAAHDSLGELNAARSPELDALAAYLASLRTPASPYQPSSEILERGERAFQRWGCAACHRPPLYTDLNLHPIEVGDPALERNSQGSGTLPRFDTPSLLGAWATAPYFHDGSAATLRDTLFQTGFHGMGFAMDRREVEDIVAFMQSLP